MLTPAAELIIGSNRLKIPLKRKATGVNRQTERMNKKEGDGRKDDAVDDDSLRALWVKSSLTQTHPGPMHVGGGGAEIPLSQRRGLFFSLSLSVS